MNVMAETIEQEMRVSGQSPVHELATAVYKGTEEGARIVLACIGVQAVNQAVKAVAIANGKSAPTGYLLYLMPFFDMRRDAVPDKVEMTVMKLRIIKHKPSEM